MHADCGEYDPGKIEQFWQKFWEENQTFCAKEDSSREKYYVLDMFPYPSASGLHIGHPEGYVASDIVARYKRARGYNVLHPMGWDAFGLPAEQHAISTGVHPELNTAKNIEIFRQQIKRIGLAIDWDREINTTDPQYFRWTQWIFLQLFKRGLAYVDERPIWWCEGLKSVLANEEVINGRSERGNFPVHRKNLRQWILRITKYADKLLDGLSHIDWPDSTKRQQIAWIGKSTGANVRFKIYGQDGEIEVYTTRPDTLFGVTYLALAPEHSLLEKIVAAEHIEQVKKYIEASRSKSDLERTDLAKTKTGVPTGAYGINPVSGARVEIWVADYVLASCGSGAIMAVPAHDERDYAFAKCHNISILQVIDGGNGAELPYTGSGNLINSGEFSGMPSEHAKVKIVEMLQMSSRGNFAQNYKLRDWLFSRQRYWGEPIPIIWVEQSEYERAISDANSCFREFLPDEPVACDSGGKKICALPLCSKHLPLKLPAVTNYLPSSDGESPLSNAKDWVNVRINVQTGEIFSADSFSSDANDRAWIFGRRETNTMPQWAGSCWYYLRYMSPNCETSLVDSSALRYWKSPDFYIGGAEHAVLHLLYARFWHRFLFDIGAIDTDSEPFQKLFHQGIILGEDGMKMSKSRGNGVNPDEIVSRYGADALRLYEMFLGPLDMVKPWNSRGIEGVCRFLKRIWHFYVGDDGNGRKFQETMPDECRRVLNETIGKVGSDIEDLKFNTAISQLMICLNTAIDSKGFGRAFGENFLRILAPFAPHIAEELWARLGNSGSIADAGWPQCDALEKFTPEKHKIIIQVNGKVRAECFIDDINMPDDEIFALAMSNADVSKHIAGKNITKKVYVRGKIINFAVK
ncbi:MAG: leucine--tRNA ligase [Puniceicoccales bacterium]|jgi:leucyl-tRNA synthetase|nr:leucine--tRNA ligase [Puniceicoccales bacterium]